MRYLYAMAVFVVVVIGAYCAGVATGRHGCRADFAASNAKTQLEIIKQSGKIDAETFNHDTDDIRRILHEKYTIGSR